MLAQESPGRWRARGVVGLTIVVAAGSSAIVFSGCGDEERPHAPLPDAGGVGGGSTTSSSKASSTGVGGDDTSGTGGTQASSSSGGLGGSGGAPCENGLQDGTETDIDCGGADCAACADGKGCSVGADCVSLSCEADVCAVATCSDRIENGSETDLDCGGSCDACAIGKACVVGADCETLSCVAAKCAPPTCTDNVKNGAETGKDCGGPNCADCPVGETCSSNADCQSLVCDTELMIPTCLAPACDDGVKNGSEPDTDCGGTCPAKCAIGKSCVAVGDCVGGPSANCVTGKCACPPGMVIIPIAGEGTYCIDQTEVSYNEYATFYAANPAGPAFKPDPQCTGNADYTPVVGWPPPPSQFKRPVVAMEWCDAYAYCAYVGKRLCGHIGGGANAFSAFADHAQSEWFNACTANGQNLYPYGDTYSSNTCVGESATSSVDVKELNSAVIASPCIGGSSTFLYHMSGNVSEWEDSCESNDANASCRVRGGAFAGNATSLACAADQSAARTSWSVDRGFRCCL